MAAIYTDPYFIILSIALLGQLLLYLLLFRRLAGYKVVERKPGPLLSVSIIIAAKNEARNLKEFLAAMLEQDYPEFEVIVVNDQSYDGTEELLEQFQLTYKRLRVVKIDEHVNEFAGKKLALTLGFKAAKNEILLLTDADCVPESTQWIRQMAGAYDNDTQIVLGFSPYTPKATLLNAFIRFDTFYTALQYFSFALAGMPYMGVGRNLSYRKEFFFKSKGFAPFLKIISGDDDLFINRHATAGNTAIQLHPESFVRSRPKGTFSRWLKQKRRHLQTGKLYRGRHKQMLSLVWFSNLFFYVAVIAACLLIKPFWIGLAALGVRMLLQLIISYLALKKLRMAAIWPLVPFFDVIYQLIYLPVMGAIGLVTRPRKSW